MTANDLAEIEYLTQERIGILLQGQREPTADELSAAHREALTSVWKRNDNDNANDKVKACGNAIGNDKVCAQL